MQGQQGQYHYGFAPKFLQTQWKQASLEKSIITESKNSNWVLMYLPRCFTTELVSMEFLNVNYEFAQRPD